MRVENDRIQRVTGAWFTHTALARQSAGSFCHGALLILLLFILKDSPVHMVNFMVMLLIRHDYYTGL